MSVARYNNGGEWLNSVFQTGPGENLTGFVHAEYHYREEDVLKVHKSISLGEAELSSHSDQVAQFVARTLAPAGPLAGRF